MITEQTETEKESVANEELSFEKESTATEMREPELPKAPWFVHHVFQHLLPFLKD
jgi:hypothetical protein